MDCTTTATTTFNRNTNSLSNASNEANEMSTSHDEVDFVPVATTATTTNNITNNNHINNNKTTSNGSNSNYNKMSENATSSCSELNANSNLTSNIFGSTKTHTNEHLQYQQQQQAQQKSLTKSKKKSATTNSNNTNNNNNNTNDEPKKKNSAKDRLSLFSTLGRRISQKALGHKDPYKSGSNCSVAAVEMVQAVVTEKTPTTTTACTKTTTNTPQQHANTTPARQRTFVKSSSIARLLGNTYQHHMKKFEKHQQQQQQLSMEKSKPNNLDGKFHTFGGRRRPPGPYLNRFKQYSKDDADVNANGKDDADGASDAASTMDFSEILEMEANTAEELQHVSSGLERFCDYDTVAPGEDEAAAELGGKTMRTLSRSLGRLWGKRLHSVEISTPDPEYKVSYLGNVLTGWAKGEGCVEKQLNTLWRNYTQNNKPDMIMRIKVSASGLKATTRQHGLTEYWANRITHCCAPKNYPRIFCWVYRHEGRKMKHELRCHAVLCSKEKVVQDICNTLKENLKRALREFKREKILKQNARLSLANAAYENPSLPQRKILLFVGGNNYRPPLERSKSAPKLMAIEEAIGEEEGEDAEETNEPEMKSCCQKDSLYPAMTLGRRRCRRGHSIRRTGKARPLCSMSLDESKQRKQNAMSAADTCCHNKFTTKEYSKKQITMKSCQESVEEEQPNSYGSDESDDFEKLLKYNDYDTNTSLATELLPYFDMQLHKNTSSSLSDLCQLTHDEEEEPLSLPPTINTDPMAHPAGDVLPNEGTGRDAEAGTDNETHVNLRRDGVCSDGEEDFLDADDMYFRQATILNILHRNSMRKMAQFSLSSDEGSSSIDTNSAIPLQYRHQTQSSISSNTSSNATTNSSINDGHIGLAPGKRHSGGDSDEGSISSGCETASTVTANQDDLSLQYRHDNKQLLLLQEQQQAALFDVDNAGRFFNNMSATDEHAAAVVTVDEIYQRLEARLQRRQNSDATTFSSSSTITLKLGTGSEGSLPDSPNDAVETPTIENTTNSVSGTRVRRQRQRQSNASTAPAPPRDRNADDTDSECSDESGYVEYREEREKTVREKVSDVERRELEQQQQESEHHPIAHQRNAKKPILPPKPMPRRTLSGGSRGTIVFSDPHSSNSTAV